MLRPCEIDPVKYDSVQGVSQREYSSCKIYNHYWMKYQISNNSVINIITTIKVPILE